MSRPPNPLDLMDAEATGEFVQSGRVHEARHRLDEAVESYLKGGAFKEAARVLSHQGRFREAGETLLYYLPVEPTPVRQLKDHVRRHALEAALCFARGGARREAVGLLMNLGEHQRAASLLSMAGMRQEAVKAMRGQPIEDSPWPPGIVFQLKPAPTSGPGFARTSLAGMPAVPGSAPFSLSTQSRAPVGSPAALPAVPRPPAPAPPSTFASPPPRAPGGPLPPFESSSREVASPLGRVEPNARRPAAVDINALLDLAPSDARMPDAAREVLDAKWRQEPLSPRVLHFLDRYVEVAATRAPHESERATLYAIGRLCEHHDRTGSARKAYAAVRDHADAAERLSNIESGLVETNDGRWLPLHMVVDGGVTDFAALPDLAELAGGGAGSSASQGASGDGAASFAWEGGRQGAPDDAAPETRRAPAKGKADETLDFDEYMAGSPPTTFPRSGSFSGRQPVKQSGAWISSDHIGAERSPQDHSGSHGPINEGSVVADRYRIESFVGQGGMATVYRAMDMELEEVVAIKVFQQVVQNRQGLDRFRREMKLSRKLIHPNVVRIFEFGTWRGARYITMELLRGDDLENHMKKAGGLLAPAQALSLMMQACDGLGAAHKAGVIHRDVKPQNLFVIEEGKRLKVMDFGIAKVDNSTTISITGVRVGTPRYMSPEQIQGGGEVGPAADLYALGGVMYELFTGSPVFEEEELVPLLLNHMTETPEPPSKRNPAVTPEVEAMILRLLMKNPEDRYKDCSELKRELLSAYVQAERLPSR